RTRFVEPLLRTSKATMVSHYPIGNTDSDVEDLLVVNIHGINFKSITAFRDQTDEVSRIIEFHRGPVICGGDPNTWSSARTEYFNSAMTKVGLIKVPFETDKRY